MPMPDLPPAEAIPGMMPFMPPPLVPTAASSAAAVQPLPAKVASVAAPGAAADHPAGTDIPPTDDADPIPASVAPPRPPAPEDAPASVVPKPKPAPSGVVSLMVTPNGAMESMWPSMGSVAAIIWVFQASVTPMLVALLTMIGVPNNPLRADRMLVGVSAAGLAAALAAFCRPPSELLSAADDPFWPAALLTAAACCPWPPGFVFCSGGFNGDRVAAADDALA